MQPKDAAEDFNYRIYAKKTFTQEEFNLFADISGDNNPIHVDPEFSAGTRFGATVSHGMLLYTVIWGHIQKHFPAAVQKKQYLKFPAGTYTGDEMEIELFVRPGDSADTFEINGEMRRCKDSVVTCECSAEIEFTGALPC